MPAFRAKVFVCTGCKKMISYSPDQLGTTINCPRCGEKVLLPQADALPSPDTEYLPPTLLSAKQPRRRRPSLFLGLSCCFGVLVLIGVIGALLFFPLLMPAWLQRICEPLIARGALAVAQVPAKLGDTGISITVTKMSRECPMIYQAAIRQTAATETPAYCVTVVIANQGKSVVSYRTWRRVVTESDIQRAATLRDGEGRLYGTVSFGPETWPVGTRQQADIQPGASFTDILLFECGQAAPGDYLLTLPGENLGHGGVLRFRIPRDLIQ